MEESGRERNEGMFLTLREVAERLRVSWKTINRLVNGGELPAIKIGRVWRVAENDFRDYIAALRNTAAA